MATRPGEENVATLFADVHYFYGPETDNPPHHRFNKGSYVYLFENAQEGRARIEIANEPGTEHQDAFDGFLDRTAVTYSYKHSCMVSLQVIADVADPDEWHLPTYDPTNTNIYHYPLRAVDIYFWTHLDALKFVNGVRRVLPSSQVDIRDEPAVPAPPPPPPPQQKHYPAPAGGGPASSAASASSAANSAAHNGGTNGLSHVVQKLEAVAVSGGSGGGTPPQRSGPVPAAELQFAGPPANAASAANAANAAAANDRASSASPASQRAAAAAAPAPFAYNPAAPAAPETIRPREKTPPPEDTVAHNPLQQTLFQDAATPFSPGLVVPAGLGPLSPGIPPPAVQPLPGAPSFPAPPAYSSTPPTPATAQPPYAQAGPSIGQSLAARTSTLPASAPAPFNPAASFPAFAAPPTSASAAPPAGTVAAPAAAHTASHAATTHAATPELYQAPPEAGYSNYNYSSNGAGAAGATDYSIHQQLYRPTHGEATSHHGPKKEPRGRLEEHAGRLEKGVTGVLKRFEKRFG